MLGTSVVQWVKPPVEMPAYSLGASVSLGCSTSDPAPCHVPGKAVGDGQNTWGSATHVEDKDGVLGHLAFAWPLGPIWVVNQFMEGLCRFLCIIQKAKQKLQCWR